MDESSAKRTYEELAAALANLEAEAGQHLVLQRDLISAKDQVDGELMRFKAIQGYISNALDSDDKDAFYMQTLESVIEAFEFEVAVFLTPCGEPDCMRVSAQFGFEDVPDKLHFQSDWLTSDVSVIISKADNNMGDWVDLALEQAILCPFTDNNDDLAGLIIGGYTIENADFYEPITTEIISPFTVMVNQAAAIWNTRQLTEELLQKNTRLEAEIGKYLVTQQDLISTKDHVDDELMRFKSIQNFIAEALTAETVEEFYTTTLESIIGAFELEVALFLRCDDSRSVLTVAAEFGFEEPPEELEFNIEWFASGGSRIVGPGDDILSAWTDLNLHQSIICPFTDKSGKFAGAVLTGITADNLDYFDPIAEEQIAAFTVMVQQAGAMSITRELNEEIQAQNRQLVNLTDSYSRFVPFEFLELLDRTSIEDIDAGDNSSLDVNVLFLDIRGFTLLTEKMGPAATFAWLNEVLAIMEPLIAAEKGFINQYQGDAIMALFPGPADAALRCAEAMMRAGHEFNTRQIEKGEEPVTFGLGINSGPLLLGAIGSENRLDSNVVGDTANLAARTESLTRQYGVPCIFTGFTHDRAEAIGNHKTRYLDEVIVKGREGSVKIFELMLDDRPNAEKFEAALSSYRLGDFEMACTAFELYAQDCPDDPAAKFYLQRCGHYAENPPKNWSGVTPMGEK